DGKLLAVVAAGSPNEPRSQLWDVSTGKEVWSGLGEKSGRFAFSGDGKKAAWLGGGKLLVGDLPTKPDATYRIKLQDRQIHCLLFASEDKLLAVGRERGPGDPKVEVYDVDTETVLSSFPLPREFPRIEAVALSADGKRVALRTRQARGGDPGA